MMKRFFILSMILLLAMCAGCSCNSKKSSTDDGLSVVNGQRIDKEQFIARLHQSRKGNTEPLPSDPITWLQVKAAFLDQVVERILIEQEAVRRQITVVDQDVDQAIESMRNDWPQGAFDTVLAERQMDMEQLRDQIRHNLITEMMAKKVVLPSIEVTEAEIQAYYRQNPELFSNLEQVRCRQILVKSETKAAETLTRILTGASFIDMARTSSIAPEAQNGGDLGYFSKGQMPRVVEDACFALDVYQTSDIIRSEYGYHLFYVEARRQASITPLNNARPQIVKAIKSEKLDRAWQQFLADLKASAQIQINEQVLASVGQDEI